MKTLTQSLIDQVRAAFKGKRLERLNASLAVLSESIAQGAWTTRGSAKARSGFYQGIANARLDESWKKLQEFGTAGYEHAACAEGVESLLRFGSSFRVCRSTSQGVGFHKGTELDFGWGIRTLREHGNLKLSDVTIRAWRDLLAEVAEVTALLDVTRPLPVVTPIGLSPKVTTTLKEMNLDLDIKTVKPAKIVTDYVDALDKFNRPIKVAVPRVEWTKGIVHGTSRFAGGTWAGSPQCHACGKNIPSRMYTPVEAYDTKGQRLVSLWLGCDCARNIFGIKYSGIAKGAA